MMDVRLLIHERLITNNNNNNNNNMCKITPTLCEQFLMKLKLNLTEMVFEKGEVSFLVKRVCVHLK